MDGKLSEDESILEGDFDFIDHNSDSYQSAQEIEFYINTLSFEA
jgi:hypothetical protein